MDKPVRCNETGETFRSTRAAATHLGVTSAAITHHLKGRVPRVKGMTFSYDPGVLFNPRPFKHRAPRERLVIRDERGKLYWGYTQFAKAKGLSVRQVRKMVTIVPNGISHINSDLFAPIGE